MKKHLFLIVSFFSIVFAQAQFGGLQSSQMLDPVDWSGSIEKASDTNYTLIFKAEIEPEWHVYSQHTPDGGSLPLEIDFLNAETNFSLEGETTESETDSLYNEIFGVEEIFFANNATLKQKIVLNDASINFIKAELSYQVCKESCINQEFYFVFDLKNNEVKVFSNYDKFENYGGAIASADVDNKEAKTDASSSEPKKIEASNDEEDRGIFTIFWLAFLYGFVALLTPCVFPMIPMTVGFFTKQSKTKAKGIRNALLYGFFIVVIYLFLGTIITAVFGADSLNALSTNVTFNIVFFLVLLIFAASFLGAFEIMLPNSWANKVDKQAGRGGLIGIFFMALALAIVSFSCTGPIVGTLLVQAASKGGLAPIVGMLGFSLAIAIPFVLFAMFPAWMNTLPRSGGWLNSVKVVLGFLELALALKFLSNADLVLQGHWLEREVFLAIWIAIFGTLTLYLFGKLKLPHDSPITHISVGRLGFGLIILSFTIYLIPGLWGAPLKLISGFPPPMNYSESPYGVGNTKSTGFGNTMPKGDFPEHAELGPHDILAFTDYEAGMDYAKENDLPVLLDFTGKACINCRKMEERVWSEPQVLTKLKNDMVLISLYVDIREELPNDEQYTSKTTGKRIRTVGDKWSDFQIEHYSTNAQPYYIMLDHSGNPLNSHVGYTPDVEEYDSWLQEGLDNFKETKN